MKVHLVGIGGIGVSALARYYLAQKNKVKGSDLVRSEITAALEKKGAKVFYKQKRENISPDTDLVVRSVAVPENNPEIKRAKELGIKTLTYPEALGELTKKHKTIAISGAHGKGTTTAFVSFILIEAGLDPTVIIGTNLPQFGNSNCRIGRSDYLVIEADEYRKAFLNYQPKAIVTTNIDKEHMDCYKNLTEIKNTFLKFWSRLPENGQLVVNKDNSFLWELEPQISKLKPKTSWYSLQQNDDAEKVKKAIKIPGEHNISNGLAALTLARKLGVKDATSLRGIGEYKGGWRRFQILQEEPTVVISDYAHHPTEIKATLEAVKEKYPKRRIWAVFQPHQYQRTHYLFPQFGPAFKKADRVVLTEIYSVAGREKEEIKKKVSGKKLARAVKKAGNEVSFVKDYKKIPELLKEKIREKDVLLIMGAGNIYKIAENLIE